MHLKSILELFILTIRVILYTSMLFAFGVAVILALYIGYGEYFYGNAPDSPSFAQATKLVLTNVFVVFVDPKAISPRDRTVLFAYGNAVIILFSLGAVLISSFSIFERLRAVSNVVPFDKVRPRYTPLLSAVRLFTRMPKVSDWYWSKKSQFLKDFSARVMLFHYRNADEIIVVSGDYSWLFDNKWSEQLRSVLTETSATKAKFLSHKTASEVLDEWKKFPDYENSLHLFSRIAFSCAIEDYKASLMKTGGVTSYIHLYKDPGRSSAHNISVCVFYGDKEAGELIRFTEDRMSAAYDAACQNEAMCVARSQAVFNVSNQPQ